jgi:AcrR family transcriptional regulator
MTRNAGTNHNPDTSDTERRIRRAALKVFASKGYGQASIPDIAREAGVSVGTIYNYFINKDDLRLKVISHYQTIPQILKTGEQSSTKDLRIFLRDLFDSMLVFDMEFAGYAIFLFDEIKRDENFRRNYISVVMEPYRKFVDGYLARAIKSRQIKNIDPTIMSTIIAAMFLGFTLVYAIERESGPLYKIKRENLLDMLVDIVMSGLGTGKTTRK